MSIGETVNVAFDYYAKHGKGGAVTGHYDGPATVVAIDEWPLDAEPMYRVHPIQGWKRGDMFVLDEEVVR